MPKPIKKSTAVIFDDLDADEKEVSDLEEPTALVLAPKMDKLILSRNLLLEVSNDYQFVSLNKSDYSDALCEDKSELKAKIREYYYDKAKDILSKSLMAENIIILAGAGMSVCDGGPTRIELWGAIEKAIGKEELNNIVKKIGFDLSSQDIEGLLSRIELFLGLNEDLEISKAKEKITECIIAGCSFNSDAQNHQRFLKSILSSSGRSSAQRPKIFTTNYDLEFENAANRIGAILLDGFSFASTPIFEGRFFDYDLVLRKGSRIPETENFIPNVLHLYKLHGSLDWYYKENAQGQAGAVIKARVPLEGHERVLIYPSKNKYERSYSKPYFELMSRFQSELRKKNSTTLFIVGYGFADGHINSMIEEAVLQQQNLRIVVINGGIDKIDENYMQHFMKERGVSLGSVTFLNLKFAVKEADRSDEEKTLVDLMPSLHAFDWYEGSDVKSS